MSKPISVTILASVLTAGLAALASRPAQAALSKTQLVELLKSVDERQRTLGDWQSNTYIEKRENNKVATVHNALVLRRSKDRRFVLLFTQPKTSAGQGYLRVDDNLWFYDPAVGRWERRTERERIGGTDSRRSDFDESRLSQEYDPEDSGIEQIGSVKAQVLTLRAKAGIDLPVPMMRLWIDHTTQNVLKRQEFALSGKPLRTNYYTKWAKIFSPSKKADVWYAEEVRMYDEVEKDKMTLVIVKNIDLKPLPDNFFTKAWLESQSR